MQIDIPKFVTTSGEYQKTPGSYVVNGGVLNCTCGSLKNTVRLMIEDRGSDAGGSPICMDIDTLAKNFSRDFGKCSKTGKDCVLTSMNKKWHIPAKVPAYIKWVPKPKPRGKYTVADTTLVEPATLYPVILESSLICWYNGSAGLITIDQNGQISGNDFPNINDNPQTGGFVLAATTMNMDFSAARDIMDTAAWLAQLDGALPVLDMVALILLGLAAGLALQEVKNTIEKALLTGSVRAVFALRKLWEERSGAAGTNSTSDDENDDTMIGENGAQTGSTTTGKDTNTGDRVDVENPNPGKRPGNIHIHIAGIKYYFDLLLGAFVLKGGAIAPKAIQKFLGKEWVLRAIQKAKEILGI